MKRFASKASWRSKLEKPQEAAVHPIEPEKQARFGGATTMLIPRPLDVDAAVRLTPEGRLVTAPQLRSYLAREAGAEVTCPLVTGIFLRIAAETAVEDEREGRQPITPFWRVLTEDGRLNPKFPGGVEEQARRLEAEGYTLIPGKGKAAPRVADFRERLAEL